MICYDCGTELIKKNGLHWEDKKLGKFYLKGEAFQECPKCGDEYQMISFKLLGKMEEAEKNRAKKLMEDNL